MSVFGVSTHANPIQCVEVQNSSRRTWLRLVGLRCDVQLWDAEPRVPPPAYPRKYVETFDAKADNLSVGDAKGESWIAAVLEPYRRQYLRECELFLPLWDHSEQSFAILAGWLATPLEAEATEAPSSRPRGSIPTKDVGSVGAASGVRTVLKELVVFRSPPVVHVYNVVSHGRRFYRTLIASSDNAFCLHDMPCTLFLDGEEPRLVAGDPRAPSAHAPSLVITRSLTKALGTQAYLPERLLRGLLPAALLEHYAFWQNADGSLTGKSLSSDCF